MAYQNPGISRFQPPKKELSPDDLITQQFAGLRASQQAQMEEAKRQNALNLARNANASGGFGGAEQKLQEQGQRELEKTFAGAQGDLGAQEAAARLQSGQFEKEFAENQKTNMINALTALKSAGFLANKQGAVDNITNFLNRFGGAYGGKGTSPYAAQSANILRAGDTLRSGGNVGTAVGQFLFGAK